MVRTPSTITCVRSGVVSCRFSLVEVFADHADQEDAGDVGGTTANRAPAGDTGVEAGGLLKMRKAMFGAGIPGPPPVVVKISAKTESRKILDHHDDGEGAAECRMYGSAVAAGSWRRPCAGLRAVRGPSIAEDVTKISVGTGSYHAGETMAMTESSG